MHARFKEFTTTLFNKFARSAGSQTKQRESANFSIEALPLGLQLCTTLTPASYVGATILHISGTPHHKLDQETSRQLHLRI